MMLWKLQELLESVFQYSIRSYLQLIYFLFSSFQKSLQLWKPTAFYLEYNLISLRWLQRYEQLKVYSMNTRLLYCKKMYSFILLIVSTSPFALLLLLLFFLMKIDDEVFVRVSHCLLSILAFQYLQLSFYFSQCNLTFSTN